MLLPRYYLFSLGLLCVSASTAIAKPVLLDRLDASVNSTIIYLSDTAKFRKTVRLRLQLDPLFAGTALAAKGEKAPEADITQFLVDEKLIMQAFPVTDEEVRQEIGTIQANNHIDGTKLKQALTEQGFSYDDYFELIRSSASKRNLIDRDIRTKVTVSDDDVKNYYYNHYSKSSAAPRGYHLILLSFAISDYKNAGAARDTAQRAFASLKAGEAFDAVAKNATVDGANDLGTLPEDQIKPVIRAQIKDLQAGQFSPVFGGLKDGAFYIVKLEGVESADADRYGKVKEEIRSQIVAGEYQHQISLWLERQRQNAFIHRAGESALAELPQAQR